VLWKAGDDVGPSKKAGGIPESECEFTSIQELRRAVRKRGNPGENLLSVCTRGLAKSYRTGLNEIMTRHAFVGVVDPNLALSLIQHSTKLYLIDHAALG
jgi:DNA mismatch repair protein MLH1